MESIKKHLPKIIIIISLLMNIAFAYFINRYNILPMKYRLLVMGSSILLLLIYILLYTKGKIKGAFNVLYLIALLFIVLGQGVAMSYANTSIRTIDEINKNKNITKTQMSYIVRKDSPYNSLEDIKDASLATSEADNEETIDKIISEYNDKYQGNLSKVKYVDYITLAKSLLSGKEEVILLNEGFRQIIEENIEDFADQTRILDSVILEGKSEEKEKEEVAKDDSFNVYISGIDTYGSLSTVSRSDVNLIISVNPTAGKVLITTIPRDSYVDIPGIGKDKLTHAGLYGVDKSIATLEGLFGENIDYYAKVNFTTLKDLIDLLGGIEVENPRAFSASGYNFVQGTNHLDGTAALVFARDRYHQAAGDFDRGKNHTRIIEGIIRKMLSPQMLLNFGDIAGVALKSVNTNMPYDKMIELVNRQLDEGTSWKIKSQALEGVGTMDLPSALMPDSRLYMMLPNEDSKNKVKESIEENNK